MEPITNTQDIIDSRDIMDRIEELEGDVDERDREGMDELESLSSIVSQASGYGDFDHGEALINENYFTEYCQDLCADIGYIPSDLPGFIKNNIDWDGVADELKQDYTEIDFDGITYFMRG